MTFAQACGVAFGMLLCMMAGAAMIGANMAVSAWPSLFGPMSVGLFVGTFIVAAIFVFVGVATIADSWPKR